MEPGAGLHDWRIPWPLFSGHAGAKQNPSPSKIGANPHEVGANAAHAASGSHSRMTGQSGMSTGAYPSPIFHSYCVAVKRHTYMSGGCFFLVVNVWFLFGSCLGPCRSRGKR